MDLGIHPSSTLTLLNLASGNKGAQKVISTGADQADTISAVCAVVQAKAYAKALAPFSDQGCLLFCALLSLLESWTPWIQQVIQHFSLLWSPSSSIRNSQNGHRGG